MKLPNGIKAELGRKLEEYILNPEHRDGKHKARLFKSILGIDLSNKELLESALLNAAATSNEVAFKGTNGFGETFVIRFQMKTDRGNAIVLSAWIIRSGENFPRLTTCFIV